MSDRYVIVYKDGHIGGDWSRNFSDVLLEANDSLNLGPAYRIRIREKPLPEKYYQALRDYWNAETPEQERAAYASIGYARLDPAKAYAGRGMLNPIRKS